MSLMKLSKIENLLIGITIFVVLCLVSLAIYTFGRT